MFRLSQEPTCCFPESRKLTKRCANRLVLSSELLIVATLAYSCPTCAAPTPQAEVEVLQPAQWKSTLLQAGATTEDVKAFETFLRRLSPADRGIWQSMGRTLEPGFFADAVRGLRFQEREQARERTPASLFANAMPVRSCESLRDLSMADTSIDVAEVHAVDDSCRVTATVTRPPSGNPIRIFVALPRSGWNGRFNGTGGGGYAGGRVENLDARVAKGYAVAATDTGNASGTAAFALGENGKPAWHRMRDNAYVGIHEMTVVGKLLTQAFYDIAPRYAYFIGGSTGGRQALTEAQRFPQDYDGILALCPAIARDRYVPAQLWPQILMREANNFLPRSKREAATAAAVKACDGADGVMDGVIDDPTRCRYDPVALVGTEMDGSTFTASDARIIRAIWEGPRGHDGRFLWWGPTPGTDLSVLARTADLPLAGKPNEEGLDWFRYFLVLDPKWDWRTLTRGEFELLFEQSMQMHARIYGGDDPDLTGFRDRGGKLLIVHGLADQVVPPQASIAYYDSVLRRMGSAQRSADFVGLFLVPGVGHGFVGAGPSPTGMMDALIGWVEEGRAPEWLLAESFDKNEGALRVRRLLPYQPVARYSGRAKD